MRTRTQLAVALPVVVALLVGIQLGFTAVGVEIGPGWGDPTAVDSLRTDDGAAVTSLDAAGTGSTATVAWVTERSDGYSVHLGDLRVESGSVAVENTRTVARSGSAMVDVAVAAGPDGPAVVWENESANAVRLWHGGETRTVSNSRRVEQPSVTQTSAGPAVAYQAYNGSRFDVRVRLPAAESGRWLGHTADGDGSPSVAGRDTALTVVWRSERDGQVLAASGSVAGGTVSLDDPVSVGRSRAFGGFNGRTKPTLAADATPDGARLAWTDIRTVETTTVEGGNATPATSVGAGRSIDVAVGGTGWTVAWIADTNNRGFDVQYATAEDGGVTSGTVSQFSSDAGRPSPVGTDVPAVVWTERGGGTSQVLAVARDPGNAATPVERLRSSTSRFAFIALAGVGVGLVTVPLMPWVATTALVAFVLTTRTVADRALAAVVAAADRMGRETSIAELRRGAERAPVMLKATLLVALNLALLELFTRDTAVTEAVAFSDAVEVSLVAFAATLVVVYATGLGRRSAWAAGGVFAYLQTAALWMTVFPGYL